MASKVFVFASSINSRSAFIDHRARSGRYPVLSSRPHRRVGSRSKNRQHPAFSRVMDQLG